MNILFVTSYYPPSGYGGGYMQLCEEVADGLSARGHAVAVLTSTYRDSEEIVHLYPIYRFLPLDPDWHCGRFVAWQFFIDRRQRERRAVSHLRQLVAEIRPDVVFFWHTLHLPRALLQEAEQLPGITVAYYLADYLPERPDEYIDYWQVPPVHWLAKLFKRPLARLALYILACEDKPISPKYENVICVSDYVRHRLVSQGLVSTNATVIRNGVNLSCFSLNRSNRRRFAATGLRCLVAGRVVPEKGIHTAIEALVHLRAKAKLDGVMLTILGGGPADYFKELQERVHDNHLQDVVQFRSPVPREQMPEVLARHDVLILPSECDEALARAMQEAMAMGSLVIGTITGGSGELMVHERTGLVFEPGNSESLAVQLSRVLNEPELAACLAEAGRQTVIKNFNIQRTIEQIEGYLLDLMDNKVLCR